jgi:hypothetical protein
MKPCCLLANATAKRLMAIANHPSYQIRRFMS